MTFPRISVLLILGIMVFTSCKKETFITSPNALLSTSVDSLMFDTVFTTAGSITKQFKIFNLNNQKLRVSVSLKGGSASPFKINVDGIASPSVNNIEIAANDSIYVFVQVNVNPNSATAPFILADTISINYNGNNAIVPLQAYGQNANFMRCAEITNDTTWSSTLPFVILCQLKIDSGKTLTLQHGCRIYVHADAPILVDGTLLANGIKTDSIVFRGDRLDPDYKDLPASWPGIYFRTTSINNAMVFAEVRNAYNGIVVANPPSNLNPKLTLSKCIIDNTYQTGLFADNTSIVADNCLISNCGQNIRLLTGGNYSFYNCTVVSYGDVFIDHKYPVLDIENLISGGASFTNCIFWGDNGNVTDEINLVSNSAPLTFTNILYKGTPPPNAINSVTGDPSFDSVNVVKPYFDFHINAHPNTIILDAGTTTLFPIDLDGFMRMNNAGDPPDLGCYEKK